MVEKDFTDSSNSQDADVNEKEELLEGDDEEYSPSRDNEDDATDSRENQDDDADGDSDGDGESDGDGDADMTDDEIADDNDRIDLENIKSDFVKKLQEAMAEASESATQDRDRGRTLTRSPPRLVLVGRVTKPKHVGIRKTKNIVKNPAIELYTQDELDYFRSLDRKEKVKIAKVEQRIFELNEEIVPLRFKVLNSVIDDKIKSIAVQKMNYLSRADPSSGEYNKTMNYVQAMCRIPFGIHKQLAVNANSPREDIRAFLLGVKDALDNKVYGHADAKTHIVRLLAQWIANPNAKGMAIGIQGSAGTGKTRLVKDGICTSLGLPFAFLPLGGASDGSFLEGHSYTYEGATWGKIVDILMKAGCMNPVIFFDELDKISETHRGEEVVNMLVHLTDATQNDKVHDRYFADLDFDLSRCLMIFSYNDESKINPILYDRLIKIHTNGYSITDKIKISQEHMIPEIIREYNLKTGDIVFTDDIIRKLTQEVDEEEGVRNLRRALHDIISSINLNNMLSVNEEDTIKFPYTVVDEDIKKYLNHKKDSMKSMSHHMIYM